jgi:metal-responsive CopG/Arc/MetJ family transcriptional regulator
MSFQKVAITVPPSFLERLDRWAKKTKRSRSRFIVEELNKRLALIEDETITQLYNEAYEDKKTLDEDKALAEEMVSISTIHEEEDKW